jgi:hypothetical protein
VRVRMDDPEIEICRGSFDALDRHAELVREALLLEGDGVIEYSIGDQDFVDERCNLDSVFACANGADGAVFTSFPFIQHEIVHAVRFMDPEISIRSSPIEEGLAILFGSDDLGQETVPLNTLDIFDDPRVIGGSEYYRAGYSMALLLERHGAERLRNFDLLARDRPEDQAFEEAFGETRVEFAAFADAAPLCDRSQWWIPLLECDGEPIVADPGTGVLTLSGNIACGEPDVQGPELTRIWTSRLFRLDESTSSLGYEFDMPEDATLEIVGCSSGCPQRFAYIGTRYSVGSVSNGLPGLEPGEYFLRMSRPIDGEGDGRFELTIQ